jgi:hypothetical protein
MKCATSEQLFALTQNYLSAEQVKQIRGHLHEGCESCRQYLDKIQTTLAAAASREPVGLPDWLLDQAMNLLASHVRPTGESRLERIPAILLVDSYSEGPLVGFRSAGAMPRQMLYRAGDYNVNLAITCTGRAQGIDIMGQPIPLRSDVDMLAEAEVELLKSLIVVSATRSNEFGAFILSSVKPGVYDLSVQSQHHELFIMGLHALTETVGRR